MRIDPAIAALRRDRASQCRIQAAMAAAGADWRAGSDVADVLDAIEPYGAGTSLAECPALAAILADERRARAFVVTFIRRFCAALADEPLGQPPFRHGFDGRHATLLLARAGRAQLVLHAVEPGEHGFASASFSDAERHEIVLAGEARARVVRRADFTAQRLALTPGVALTLDLAREALQVIAAERRLVLLRLHRVAVVPGPSREFGLADGALLHQSAGNAADSRTEVALAVLGRMRRAEASPAIAEIARAPGDAALRWQALRECLALDTAEGFRALSAVAGAPADPLAGAAARLRKRLVAAHPDRGMGKGAPCPA
jgi:hypothetical protein